MTTRSMASIKALLAKRSLLFETAESLLERVHQPELSYGAYHQINDKCKCIADKYEILEDAILQFNATAKQNSTVSVKAERNAFDTIVDQVFLKCADSAADKPSEPNSPTTLHNRGPIQVQLPPIAVPKFSGENFSQFWEIFSSLVHNEPSISDTVKYHHLLNSLSNEVKLLLAGFTPINGDNYGLAVETLREHYDNKRRIVGGYVHELIAAPVLSTNYKPDELASLVRAFTNRVSALSLLNIPDLHEVLLFELAYSKLEKRLRIAFENAHPGKEPRRIAQLLSFLQARIQIDDLVSCDIKTKRAVPPNPVPVKGISRSLISEQVGKPIRTCPIDNQKHLFINCPSFLQMTIAQRTAIVLDNKLCLRCFGSHFRKDCQSQKKCKVCSGPHHGLVCPQATRAREQEPGPVPHSSSGGSPPSSSSRRAAASSASRPQVHDPTPHGAGSALPAQPATQQALGCQHTIVPNQQTLLATAVVNVYDSMGFPTAIRCVVDSGSQVEMISERVVHALKLSRTQSNTQVQGLGGVTRAKGCTQVRINSRNSDFNLNVNCLILPTICGKLPSAPTDPNLVCSTGPLADPQWYLPADVDMLLGASVFSKIVRCDLNPFNVQEHVIAQPSELGYLLLGQIPVSTSFPLALLSMEESMEATLDRLWKSEEDPPAKPYLTQEEIQAEEYFVTTTTRHNDGKYVVRLPFRTVPQLSANRRDPLAHFLRVEARLQKDPKSLELYNGYFADLYADGLMSVARTPAPYLLLHHAVHKESTSTRVRPVFDASSLDVSGQSLNSQLLPGPALQADLSQVLLRFRMQPIPLVADIKRMYNSVLIHPDDRQYQHVLWRPTPESQVLEFELNSVTFGVSPSAFLAQRAIRQLVLDEGSDFPLAAKALSTQIYVDDVVCSFPDIGTALSACDQLIQLTNRGGFQLRKFASNQEEVLEGVPHTCREVVDFKDPDCSLSVLGTSWSPENDSFSFSVPALKPVKCTKRVVLSTVARIFDCHGLLAPVTLSLKLFLKGLYQSKLDWDAAVPPDLESKWINLRDSLPRLAEFKVPRVIPAFTCDRLELVGFSDGSSVGYGAAIYLRCVQGTSATLHLLKAKAKASPVKPTLTIPRMELQASALLAGMVADLQPVISELPVAATHFFTDSSIVLCWIHTPVHRLQVYVANRINKILAVTSASDWHHVNSAANCADPASRSLTVQELLVSELWWDGPPFLHCEPIEWPPPPPLPAFLPECKKETMNSLLSAAAPEETEPIFNRFSSLNRLLRVVSWIRRFAHKCRKMPTPSGPLTADELNDARRAVLIQVQATFLTEPLSKKLKPLSVFRDTDGLYRVGGRLQNSSLSYDAKHPIVLPRESHVSMLLCREAHARTLHGGVQLMRAYLQTMYWICGVTRTLKRIRFECLRCYRLSAKPPEPVMADLPKSRFETARAFTNVSADFCGPFSVHEGPRPRARTLKAYVCVFTCMATRATHLEVVEDLSTPAFIAALDRMIARRGYCSMLFCDNATNFQGAANALKKDEAFLNKLSQRQIKFTFNCPISPWKNGITERMVGLFKSHLVRVVGKSTLTFTEFVTLVTQIEAVLNSRPLVPLAVDPEDGVLTPGHFLIGSTLMSRPEPDLSTVKTGTLSRWQVVKAALQSFWRQWHTQYLQLLMPKKKWQDGAANLATGQVVIMKQEGSPPALWPLGRISEIYPHSDGVIRVVKVDTGHGNYLRPVNRLIPLPIPS